MLLTVNDAAPKISTRAIPNVTPKSTTFKSSASDRFQKSINQTANKLAAISEKDCDTRRRYEEKLHLKERDVIAKENIVTLLEQFLPKK